jgi:hypothetical protein
MESGTADGGDFVRRQVNVTARKAHKGHEEEGGRIQESDG